MAETCGLGLYLLQEAAGRHGSRILTGDDGSGLLLRTAAAADEPRWREQRVRRRLLSLTLGASADAAETQRAARTPAPTQRRSSPTAQRPSLCFCARARPSKPEYGRRAAESGGARGASADSHIHSPTRKGPGAEHLGKAEPCPWRPLVGWRSGSGARGLPSPTAAALGLGALGVQGRDRTFWQTPRNKWPCLKKTHKSQFLDDAEASSACKT